MKVSESFNCELTEKLDRLRLRFAKQSGGVSGGVRRSAEKGSSNEFSDFRNYTHGDSLRYVDWNSYARLDKLFIKLYTEEKQTTVHILADCSASMGMEDKDWLCGMTTACLAYAALGGGDRVRLYSGSRQLSLSSKAELVKMLPFIEETSYEGVFAPSEVMSLNLNQRGRFFLLSDFMYDTEYIEKAVKYLTYKKQELTLVMITSEMENDPSYLGNITLSDSESDDKVNTEITDSVIEAYKEALKSHRRKISDICRLYGVCFTDIRTSDSFNAVLGRILGG